MKRVFGKANFEHIRNSVRLVKVYKMSDLILCSDKQEVLEDVHVYAEFILLMLT